MTLDLNNLTLEKPRKLTTITEDKLKSEEISSKQIELTDTSHLKLTSKL